MLHDIVDFGICFKMTHLAIPQLYLDEGCQDMDEGFLEHIVVKDVVIFDVDMFEWYFLSEWWSLDFPQEDTIGLLEVCHLCLF